MSPSPTTAERLAPIVVAAGGAVAHRRAFPVTAVRFADPVWAPRLQTNREQTLVAQHRLLDETGRLANFRRAAGRAPGKHEGLYFNDTDVYKWLEAAAWTLATDPDPELDRLVDATIAEVAAAQEPDGYLDTFYQLGEGTGRWTELVRTHELYCAGHLIQAAVAHHRATAKTTLLTVARRFADLICATLGPADDGKQPGTDGHEEIEMALVELFRETGETRYLDQARYFLDVRGHGLAGGDEYHQDHVPFRDQDAMVGHAVRHLYLAAGAADVYAETGEPALLATLERLFANMVGRKIYVSGGLGARHEGESFGDDYELPNDRAYTETCAAIGAVMWSWRMLLLTGETRYADLIEHTLYNAFLPGSSLDGQAYFYVNPLADDGTHRRQPWFVCACCPPNVARMYASLPGYVYTVREDTIGVHLYAAGSADLRLTGGAPVRLEQRTDYPWDGEIDLLVHDGGEFGLALRIPAWCETGAALAINGAPHPGPLAPGTDVEIRRAWTAGDVLHLSLPMPVRAVACHPAVHENAGRVAVFRGPILYCAEAVDHDGAAPADLILPSRDTLHPAHRPDLLGGVVILTAPAARAVHDPAWQSILYRTVDPDHGSPTTATRPTPLALVPYFAWANRDPGPMAVWLRTAL